MTTKSVTLAVAKALTTAFNHYNKTLFNKQLPECLVVLHRHRGAYGTYRQDAYDGFVSTPGSDTVTLEDVLISEVALNPDTFAGRTVPDILSTLVHEMAHHWQATLGKDNPKGNYHNKEFSAKMEELGLMTSATGEPGGKRYGVKMTHYILDDGAFARVTADLLAGGWELDIKGLWGDEAKKTKKKSRQSRQKWQCPLCEQAAWAAYTATLTCGACDEAMVVAPSDK